MLLYFPCPLCSIITSLAGVFKLLGSIMLPDDFAPVLPVSASSLPISYPCVMGRDSLSCQLLSVLSSFLGLPTSLGLKLLLKALFDVFISWSLFKIVVKTQT